jgi:hypothetical protein
MKTCVQQQQEEAEVQVTAIVADVRALPFADHSVDLIIDKGLLNPKPLRP